MNNHFKNPEPLIIPYQFRKVKAFSVNSLYNKNIIIGIGGLSGNSDKNDNFKSGMLKAFAHVCAARKNFMFIGLVNSKKWLKARKKKLKAVISFVKREYEPDNIFLLGISLGGAACISISGAYKDIKGISVINAPLSYNSLKKENFDWLSRLGSRLVFSGDITADCYKVENLIFFNSIRDELIDNSQAVKIFKNKKTCKVFDLNERHNPSEKVKLAISERSLTFFETCLQT